MNRPVKTICLLGATGSIGTSTLDVVRQHRDKFKILSAAIHSNTDALMPMLDEFNIEKVCIWNEKAAAEFQAPANVTVLQGMPGLLELVSAENIEYVINGLVGAIGCEPTLQAIKKGKQVGLANKETMVMAGGIINNALREFNDSSLIPIDSEHSAIFQCLAGRPPHEVESIILTASGGPFRTLPKEKFTQITRAQALKHPTWDMGPKITIDSATMMNKGLEVIEAHFLFNIPFDDVKIVIHPTSTVHSFVQFRDGSLMAQLGSPDMKLPILYALSFPERLELDIERLDISRQKVLEFFPPDTDKFTCINLAYRAGRTGGTAPAIINAANEVAVDLFLHDKIKFADIPVIISTVMDKADINHEPDIDSVIKSDAWARAAALDVSNVENTSHA